MTGRKRMEGRRESRWSLSHPFQFVWWGLPWTYDVEDGIRRWYWHGWVFGFERMVGAWARIYAWRFQFGPVEVRRWADGLRPPRAA
jgi:hypothetical protein